jgi:hypothetical protein
MHNMINSTTVTAQCHAAASSAQIVDLIGSSILILEQQQQEQKELSTLSLCGFLSFLVFYGYCGILL